MLYSSTSQQQTKEIAHTFAKTLVGGDIVFLDGDLGAGKTTFTQGVLESFGYTEPVRSPTFSIMNIYPINRGLISKVIHLDFYRFNSPDEIRTLGLEDFLEDPKIIFLIEWPEKGTGDMSSLVPTKTIHFRTISENEREININ